MRNAVLPVRVGHRGAAGHEPENTLRSIERAIDLGAELVEVDVQRTADGHLVLMHDKRVDRTTDGSGYVRDLTLAQIRALDAGGGERVPTLGEALAAARGRVGLVLELITPGTAGEVVAAVAAGGPDGEPIFASFHHAELVDVRRLRPESATLALLEGIPVRPTAFATDAAVSHVGLALDSVTGEMIHELQRKHFKVFVYTVNDSRDIEWLTRLGVDGIISDYPDRIGGRRPSGRPRG